jgi:hypothetical protein
MFSDGLLWDTLFVELWVGQLVVVASIRGVKRAVLQQSISSNLLQHLDDMVKCMSRYGCI